MLRTIIRPHPRDNQLSPIPIDFDPETLGWILDEGGRGNLMLQNELFNTMEDTWDRLRSNLNKIKNPEWGHIVIFALLYLKMSNQLSAQRERYRKSKRHVTP